MIVLGIETSCDETGIALYDSKRGLLADTLYSQASLHAQYGGVVPEMASRDHVKRMIPLLQETLLQANCELSDIDGIAYTNGPGLVGALMAGSTFARALSMALDRPSIGVHHMEGHLLAPMLSDNVPDFPFVALLASGGHTQLVQVAGIGEYTMLGQTLDDAAGEAFDKAAKMLKLPYPGGPVLAQLATLGQAERFRFPRPMCDRPGLDFSFSGLKTFTMTTLQKHSEHGEVDAQTRADIALAFERAAVDTLVIKCQRALQQTRLQRLVIAGGVSANVYLRARLDALQQEKIQVYYPEKQFCTDNGAMIAYAGCQRLLAGQCSSWSAQPRPRWSLTELASLGDSYDG